MHLQRLFNRNTNNHEQAIKMKQESLRMFKDGDLSHYVPLQRNGEEKDKGREAVREGRSERERESEKEREIETETETTENMTRRIS